ncbi:MAG: hypothetical protein M1814_006903 [Vezdaea aestivalis]|nr:MAG: hypothetical protein M1814_006903 [Vezdaea aestivalis]
MQPPSRSAAKDQAKPGCNIYTKHPSASKPVCRSARHTKDLTDQREPKTVAESSKPLRRRSHRQLIQLRSPSPSSSPSQQKKHNLIQDHYANGKPSKKLRCAIDKKDQPSKETSKSFAGGRHNLRSTSTSAKVAGQKRPFNEDYAIVTSKQSRVSTSEKQDTKATIAKPTKRTDIGFWVEHDCEWPENFAKNCTMASSSKRQRTSGSSQSHTEEKSRSWAQNRKEGEVPEQYTAKYEKHISRRGLDMDLLKGKKNVSDESRADFVSLMKSEKRYIQPLLYSWDKILDVINDCQSRNEALVVHVITPMIIPPIRSLYYLGKDYAYLEHVVDEINTNWYQKCVIEGPQLRPDLSIGLFESAFEQQELDKLKKCSVDTCTQFTDNMYFPFLMCEVKCGREGLDAADRQNMHSCCVAVKALLRIEQEADKQRKEKCLREGREKILKEGREKLLKENPRRDLEELENYLEEELEKHLEEYLKENLEEGLEKLDGHALVYSISHDQKDARLYGHYAILNQERWTYYRYRIKAFDLYNTSDLLAIYNFVQNLLKDYVPVLVKRLKAAIAVLPEPSTLSFYTSEMSLGDVDPRGRSQVQDDDNFKKPTLPASAVNSLRADKLERQLKEQQKQQEQREKELEKQLKEQREEAKREQEKQLKEQREEAKREQEKLMEELKQTREEARQQNDKIMALLDRSMQQGLTWPKRS